MNQRALLLAVSWLRVADTGGGERMIDGPPTARVALPLALDDVGARPQGRCLRPDPA